MSIIKPGANTATVLKVPSLIDAAQLGLDSDDDVPFVIDWKLFEAQEKKLSEGEIAAIGMALFTMLPEDRRTPSAWELDARLESVSQRFGSGEES